jgi:protein phosphatase
MTREEAERSAHRHVILQSLGRAKDVTTALGRLEMRRGDVFLLCSDGLSTKVADDEMLAVVREGPTHERACARLVELANERGGEDNITVILAEVAGLDLKRPAPAETATATLETVQEFDPTRP